MMLLGGSMVWRLATAVLLSGLLTWNAEARTWLCWWDYPSPDLRNRKTTQANDAASVDGHQSSKTTPMPARILGRLWRVPVLGPCLSRNRCRPHWCASPEAIRAKRTPG